MRLVVGIDAGWPTRELDEARTLVVVEGSEDRPVATLTVHHPSIVPMSLLEWASDVPRSDLPAGTASTLVSSRVARNQVGWLMQVVHTVVRRSGDDRPVEVRLSAVYQLQPYRVYAAAVIARVHDVERFDDLRARIEALFDTARPDWNGPEPAALSQLYD